MTDLDAKIPLSALDRAVCSAVSKLDLAVEVEATVQRAEMHIVSRELWRAMELDRQHRAELLLMPDPGRPRDDFTAFRRRLQIMGDLGGRLLVNAGVLDPEDSVGVAQFEGRPFAFLLELPPERFEALFNLIQEQEGRGA